jgi:hypothetical protein
MRLVIDVDAPAGDHPQGSVVTDGGRAVVFSGWLDLLRVLEIGLTGRSVPEGCDVVS